MLIVVFAAPHCHTFREKQISDRFPIDLVRDNVQYDAVYELSMVLVAVAHSEGISTLPPEPLGHIPVTTNQQQTLETKKLNANFSTR
jgi:hypothetical protein